MRQELADLHTENYEGSKALTELQTKAARDAADGRAALEEQRVMHEQYANELKD